MQKIDLDCKLITSLIVLEQEGQYEYPILVTKFCTLQHSLDFGVKRTMFPSSEGVDENAFLRALKKITNKTIPSSGFDFVGECTHSDGAGDIVSNIWVIRLKEFVLKNDIVHSKFPLILKDNLLVTDLTKRQTRFYLENMAKKN